MRGRNLPEGFVGGDRTSLDIPKDEQALLEAVKATGKPLVVVLMNGSALSVNWANQNANAILESWYPGEEGGAAVAETLAGVNNPSGRLPLTFYKGINDLPPFDDYSMKNRTYRYFEGQPLYPFGYGLSYTTFSYSKVKLSLPACGPAARCKSKRTLRTPAKWRATKSRSSTWCSRRFRRASPRAPRIPAGDGSSRGNPARPFHARSARPEQRERSRDIMVVVRRLQSLRRRRPNPAPAPRSRSRVDYSGRTAAASRSDHGGHPEILPAHRLRRNSPIRPRPESPFYTAVECHIATVPTTRRACASSPWNRASPARSIGSPETFSMHGCAGQVDRQRTWRRDIPHHSRQRENLSDISRWTRGHAFH